MAGSSFVCAEVMKPDGTSDVVNLTPPPDVIAGAWKGTFVVPPIPTAEPQTYKVHFSARDAAGAVHGWEPMMFTVGTGAAGNRVRITSLMRHEASLRPVWSAKPGRRY